MLQTCLPIPFEISHDIIYYDGPLLAIAVNGEDRYLYVDVTPSFGSITTAYLLYKITDESDDSTFDKILDPYENLEHMIADISLKKGNLDLKYGVSQKIDTLDAWFALEDVTQFKEFMKTYSWGDALK